MGKLFSPEYQPDFSKRKRGKGWRQMIEEEMDKRGQSETTFVGMLVEIAYSKDHPLKMKAIEVLEKHLAPQKKAVLPTYEFPFAVNDTPSDKIEKLIQEVSEGSMPADIASMIVAMIKIGVDVKEVTDLAQRLERLEQLLAERAGQ